MQKKRTLHAVCPLFTIACSLFLLAIIITRPHTIESLDSHYVTQDDSMEQPEVVSNAIIELLNE